MAGWTVYYRHQLTAKLQWCDGWKYLLVNGRYNNNGLLEDPATHLFVSVSGPVKKTDMRDCVVDVTSRDGVIPWHPFVGKHDTASWSAPNQRIFIVPSPCGRPESWTKPDYGGSRRTVSTLRGSRQPTRHLGTVRRVIRQGLSVQSHLS